MARLGALRQRGSGVMEEQLAPGSGLRSQSFTCVSSGYRSDHSYETPATTMTSLDRCVMTSPVGRTWVPDVWQSVTLGDVGFRNQVLPFPATPCLTLEAGYATGKFFRARLTGYGQFGEPLVEESPTMPLVADLVLPTNLNIYRIWFSKVFSRITKVEWVAIGSAPVVALANVYVGLWFLWNTLAIRGTGGGTLGAGGATAAEHRLFPANAGIGTRMRMAMIQGNAHNRYPEIQVTLRTPTGGSGQTAHVPAHASLGAPNAAGFYMGFTSTQHWITTDVNTNLNYNVWGGDPYKFRIEAARGAVDIRSHDDTAIELYTVPGAATQFDNPKTLIYDVTVRSAAGVKPPTLQVSVNGFS